MGGTEPGKTDRIWEATAKVETGGDQASFGRLSSHVVQYFSSQLSIVSTVRKSFQGIGSTCHGKH